VLAEHISDGTFDEDADLRSNLASLEPAGLRDLQDVLKWPEPQRDAFLRSLVGRTELQPLAQLIAIAETDKVVRLRLLRAIRDLENTARLIARPRSRTSGDPGRDR
jgi:hypothetical protein